ncbi:MAG: thioredoxin family protein [Patescibacteria group bacterium]|nr:thioredoxin family protein [Patescibacteria group bacterium]
MNKFKYLVILLLVAGAAVGGFWVTKRNLAPVESKNAPEAETPAQKADSEALTALTCKVTGNQPKNVCAPLKDKIAQIPDSKASSESAKTIGDFVVTDKEICKDNGKPLVYFFGSASCPHCQWEKPIAQKVFAQFKDYIVYHENFDSQNDSDVFEKYKDINPGYVPFIIIGCRYARVGAGENLAGQ